MNSKPLFYILTPWKSPMHQYSTKDENVYARISLTVLRAKNTNWTIYCLHVATFLILYVTMLHQCCLKKQSYFVFCHGAYETVCDAWLVALFVGNYNLTLVHSLSGECNVPSFVLCTWVFYPELNNFNLAIRTFYLTLSLIVIKNPLATNIWY